MNLAAALVLAQEQAPEPILPETNDFAWTAFLLVVALPIVAVVAAVVYVVRTRRIAESARAEVERLGREQDGESGP